MMKSAEMRVLTTRLFSIGAVTIVYFLLARWGFLLAQPPMNVPLLYPAAGFALAVALYGEPYLLAGIVLGALFANIGIVGSLESWYVLVGLGLISGLQAWLGAFLLRRFVPKFPPTTIRFVLRAIFIMGLTAFVTTFLGVFSLYFAGMALWQQAFDLAWTWWVSVYVGMLLITPMFVIVFQHWRRVNGEPLMWGVASTLIGLSLLVFMLARNDAAQKTAAHLNADASETAHVIRVAFSENEDLFVALRAFFEASSMVDRTEFSDFVLPLMERAPSIAVMGWAPRVSETERSTFEQSARDAGIADFEIWERDSKNGTGPAGGTSEFFPITYVEPFEANRAVLGFDLNSDVALRQSLGHMVATGEPVFIPQNRPGQIGDTLTDAILVGPMYSDGTARASGARSGTARGLLFLGFSPQALVENAIAQINAHDIELYLFDVSGANPQLLLFHPSLSGPQTLPANVVLQPAGLLIPPYYSTQFDLYGRTWQLVARPGPAYVAETGGWNAWLSLLIGLASAGVFMFYMDSRQRAEEKLRAGERRSRVLLQAIPDLMFRVSRQGVILDFSAQETDKLYVPPLVFIGKPLADVLPPEVAAQCLDAIEKGFETGKLQTFEYQMQTGDEVYYYEARLDTNAQENEAIAIVRDITHNRRATDALRDSEARYRLISENTADVIWVLDLASQQFVYVSPSVEKLRGYTAPQVMAQKISESLTPESLAHITAVLPDRLAAFLQTHEVVTYTDELDQLRSDGSLVHTEVSTNFVVNDAGQVQVIGISRDFTERRRAAELLQKSQASLEMAQALAHLGSWELDPRTGEGFWSKEMFRLFGFEPAEGVPLLETFMERVEPADRERLLQAQARAIETGERLIVEYRIHPTQDEVRFIEATLHAVRDAASQSVRMAGTALDITERKQAEDKLRTSEHRSQVLLQAIPDTMCRVTRTGEILDYVAKGQELGVTTPASPGQSLNDIFSPAVSAQWQTAIQAAFESGQLQTFEYQFGRDETELTFEARIISSPGENEAVAIIRNVTQARQSTEQIRRLSRVVDQMDDAVFITNVDGVIVYVNPAFVRQTGYSRAEAVGQTPRILKSGLESHEFYQDLWSKILSGETFQTEIRNRKKSGELFYEATTITPIRDERGAITHFVATGKDITARKQMEHDLQERLKELTCLRQVQRLLEKNPAPEEAFSQLTRFLEIGMQYPEISVGIVEWDGEQYGSTLTAPPVRTLAADLVINGVRRGSLLLHYTQDMPFIFPEEQNLLDGLGRTVSLWLERRFAEQALAEERNSLARRVDERTADLVQANLELERAARMKDEFLSSMSHELRTPLNGILGLSESLEEGVYGSMTPQQLAPLRAVAEAGHHLLDLINDILDLSKIEAGRLDLHIEPVNAEEVCKASLRMVKEPAQQKHLKTTFAIESDIGPVLADARRLKQMLVNLLGNAVKFTPENGQVGLDVTLNAAADSVRFMVWDTGIGIAPDKLDRLFKPFSQIDSSLTRQYSGTGLGLSLVRRLAEMHGGSVGVESEPGKGSRFFIDLPMVSNTQPAPDAETYAPPLRVQLVLVVDDSISTGDQLTRYLRELGAQVTVEYSGDKAVERAVELQPNVILLDLLMPGRSGWDVLAALKAEPRTQAIPVIISSVVEERARGSLAGASAYLVKPVTRESLRVALQTAFAIPPAVSVSASQSAADADAAADEAADPSRPLILLAEDNFINQSTFSSFLTAKGYRVVTAVNGADALVRAQETNPALVLMDIQMPVMDGLEATRRLREMPQFAGTPVIALTALAMPGDRERCLEAGANEYLTKPVSLKQLVLLIQEWLEPKNGKLES